MPTGRSSANACISSTLIIFPSTIIASLGSMRAYRGNPSASVPAVSLAATETTLTSARAMATLPSRSTRPELMRSVPSSLSSSMRRTRWVRRSRRRDTSEDGVASVTAPSSSAPCAQRAQREGAYGGRRCALRGSRGTQKRGARDPGRQIRRSSLFRGEAWRALRGAAVSWHPQYSPQVVLTVAGGRQCRQEAAEDPHCGGV